MFDVLFSRRQVHSCKHVIEVRPDHIRKMLQSTADDFDNGLLDVEWVELTAPEPKATASFVFVTPDAELQRALSADMPGAACAASIADAPPGARVLLALDGDVAGVLTETLAAVRGAEGKAVTIVTRASQPVGSVADPRLAGVWGFARTARAEDPSLVVRCVDLDVAQASAEAVAAALAYWLPRLEKSNEMEVAVRAGADAPRLLAPRLQRCKAVDVPMYLQMSARGSLANLRPVPQDTRPVPEAGEVVPARRGRLTWRRSSSASGPSGSTSATS